MTCNSTEVGLGITRQEGKTEKRRDWGGGGGVGQYGAKELKS